MDLDGETGELSPPPGEVVAGVMAQKVRLDPSLASNPGETEIRGKERVRMVPNEQRRVA